MIRFVSVGCLLCSAAVCMAQADFAVQPSQVDTYKQLALRQIDNELLHIQRAGQLDNDRIAQLREGTMEFAAASAQTIMDAITNGDSMAIRQVLGAPSQEMLDMIQAAAKQALKPDEFAVYQADAKARQAFLRTSGQRSVLFALDSLLSLNQKQQSAMAKLLMSSWKPEWTATSSFMTQQAETAIVAQAMFKQIPPDELATLLRPSQLMILKGIMELDAAAFADPEKANRLLAEQIMTLKVEEIKELCRLSEPQVETLDTAGDGAIEAVVKMKVDAMASLRGENGAFIGNPDPEIGMILSTPVSVLLDQHEVWTTGVKESLDADQHGVYQKRQVVRKRIADRATVDSMVATMAQNMGLSGKQQAAWAKLVRTESKPTDIGPRSFFRILDVPVEKYKKLLDAKQFEKLSPLLDQLRQQAELLK